MTAEQQDERDLIAAAQADPATYLAIYDRYFHRIWAYLRSHVDRAEAEDLTSDVFRRALEALPSYEWRGVPFSAWLLRVAANALANHWIKVARESPDPPPDLAQPGADVEHRELLFQLVDRLPESQRQLIELRYIVGLSLVEAGHRLGKTEGAAKQLHRRALKQLRQDLLPRAGKDSSNG